MNYDCGRRIKNLMAKRKEKDHAISAGAEMYMCTIIGQLPLPPPDAITPSTPPPPATVDAWVIFDVRSGTALDAKSSNGACHIPKATIKTIANTSTATIALGSFTLFMSGASSMYIFLIIQA